MSKNNNWKSAEPIRYDEKGQSVSWKNDVARELNLLLETADFHDAPDLSDKERAWVGALRSVSARVANFEELHITAGEPRKAPRQKTLTIAGRKVTLVPGRRYLASRPMGTGGDVTVKVTDITETSRAIFDAQPAAMITGLTYEQANKFLDEFNDEEISFNGRLWH